MHLIESPAVAPNSRTGGATVWPSILRPRCGSVRTSNQQPDKEKKGPLNRNTAVFFFRSLRPSSLPSLRSSSFICPPLPRAPLLPPPSLLPPPLSSVYEFPLLGPAEKFLVCSLFQGRSLVRKPIELCSSSRSRPAVHLFSSAGLPPSLPLSLMMYWFIRRWILGWGPHDGLHRGTGGGEGVGGGDRSQKSQVCSVRAHTLKEK